jgi:hypothetical protein
VLTLTEMLRRAKVVGKFVEFFGEGAAGLTLTDRATLANMAPEYGATMGFFPVDENTLAYLRGTGRRRRGDRRLRGLLPARGCSACRSAARSTTAAPWRSTSPRWRRRWPGRSGRRTASRSARQAMNSCG